MNTTTTKFKQVEPETVDFAKKLHDQRMKANRPLFLKAIRKLRDEYTSVVMANEIAWQAIREKNLKEFNEKVEVLKSHYGVV